MISKASRRVSSHILVQIVMLPPANCWNAAPSVANTFRDLTTMPRTTPSVCVTRKFGNSNAVVAIWCETEYCRGLTLYGARCATGSMFIASLLWLRLCAVSKSVFRDYNDRYRRTSRLRFPTYVVAYRGGEQFASWNNGPVN